jgi:hypothetical protein
VTRQHGIDESAAPDRKGRDRVSRKSARLTGTSGGLRPQSTMYPGGTRQGGGSGATNPPNVRTAEDWDWQLLARCRGGDLSMFFHGDGERGMSRRQRERKAKQFCAQCPVVMQCLEHSLRFREAYGVWGGHCRNRAAQDSRSHDRG